MVRGCEREEVIFTPASAGHVHNQRCEKLANTLKLATEVSQGFFVKNNIFHVTQLTKMIVLILIKVLIR